MLAPFSMISILRAKSGFYTFYDEITFDELFRKYVLHEHIQPIRIQDAMGWTQLFKIVKHNEIPDIWYRIHVKDDPSKCLFVAKDTYVKVYQFSKTALNHYAESYTYKKIQDVTSQDLFKNYSINTAGEYVEVDVVKDDEIEWSCGYTLFTKSGYATVNDFFIPVSSNEVIESINK